MQLQERGDEPLNTTVDFIDAELLEVMDECDYSIASVRFFGQIRENDGAPERLSPQNSRNGDRGDSVAVFADKPVSLNTSLVPFKNTPPYLKLTIE